MQESQEKDRLESLVGYAKNNTQDTAAYILLVVGIILLFFTPHLGGALIGLVAGFYFSDEISKFIKNHNQRLQEVGIVKGLIFGGTLLALFISAPMIFIAAAITVALKQLIASNDTKKEERK